jgi:hypothetical protein
MIWQLQADFDNDGFREELLHDELEQQQPGYRPLLNAIRAYEAFARSLQDAFDVLKAEAARLDVQGFDVTGIAGDADFKRSVSGLHERFEAFGEPVDAGACAIALCSHHEAVQRAKSADGKRPWFDRLGQDCIHVRHAYREPRREIQPGRYVHDYRGKPIRRHLVFTLPVVGEANPARSSLDDAIQECRRRGGSPNQAWVASPFFDADDGTSRATASLCKLMARGG